MMMQTPEHMPVIVGVGEYVDRPRLIADSLEPVDLMARALTAADIDGGGGLLAQASSIDLVGIVSWRYDDPVGLLCQRLAIDPARKTNASMGGDTPTRLIHEAAIRIARGEQAVAAIVGGEASHAVARANREAIPLPWTPIAAIDDAVVFPASRLAKSHVAIRLGVTAPAQIYPFYEIAAQAAWGQTPADGNAQSAQLWAQYAAIAADNPSAWIRTAPTAGQIATITPENRLINWPYPKLMTANPNVNQAAAVIVSSLAVARAAGIPEHRIVHVWGGGLASEPEDFLKRDRYDHSTAQATVLDNAVKIVGGDAATFDRIELYSCFPIVAKMALRTLGPGAATQLPTVAGGLTFFGGPLNNYMSHAVVAMVRQLRVAANQTGLLYGQGGFFNKHHTLVVGTSPPAQPIALDYSMQVAADRHRGPVPALVENYSGPARIETCTIRYARDLTPIDGIVIALTPAGDRVMAQVPVTDRISIAILGASDRSAVGTVGDVWTDSSGLPVWSVGTRPAAQGIATWPLPII